MESDGCLLCLYSGRFSIMYVKDKEQQRVTVFTLSNLDQTKILLLAIAPSPIKLIVSVSTLRE